MATKTNDPEARDTGLDAAVAEARAQRHAEETALIRAQQERARPAVDRARTAWVKLEAFEQAFGRQLREYDKGLKAPELDERLTHGQHAALLAQVRRQVESLLIGIAQVPLMKRTVAEIDNLTLKDLQPFNIVGNRIERLNGMATFADALPENLDGPAAGVAEITRIFNRLRAEASASPVMDSAPPPERVDAVPPRPEPLHAKGAVSHD
jgi:hypothetical protein